jgi:hypothetical protein
MMMAMPSNHRSISTCLCQKPMGNGITDSCRKESNDTGHEFKKVGKLLTTRVLPTIVKKL